MGPFSSPPPSEVLLKRAPLIRVLAQVRFPGVLSVNDQSFVAGFQEAIRSTYPILRVEQTQGFNVTPMGVAPVTPEMTWRFLSDPAETWRVSLSPTSLTFETKDYGRREDFVRRFRELVVALRAKVDPKFTERIGVRYVNRLADEDFARLSSWVRPELLGLLSHPQGDGGTVLHQLSEMLATTGDTTLAARWGAMPPGQSYDLSAIDPIRSQSWLLDIDSYIEKLDDADVEAVVQRTIDLSAKAYTFFRWVMTEAFVESRREAS